MKGGFLIQSDIEEKASIKNLQKGFGFKKIGA
jgi:hypothetical protein